MEFEGSHPALSCVVSASKDSQIIGCTSQGGGLFVGGAPSHLILGHHITNIADHGKQASVTERHYRAPAVSGRSAMNAIIYPLHFQRSLESRWAARMVRDEPRRSPSQGTDTCACGHVITAPNSSAYLPTGIVNEWGCSACGRRWDTIADTGAAPTKPDP